jgi:hypothetical protein
MIKKILRHLPASIRITLSERYNRIKALLGILAVWRIVVCRVNWTRGSTTGFWFIGRKTQLQLANVIFNQSPLISDQANENAGSGRAIISELPFPGSYCIPHYLSTILTLSNSIESQIKAIDKNKYRLYKNERPAFSTRLVSDIQDIKRLQKTMLEPYALERYGSAVAQLTDEEVIKMATQTGAFHLVCEGDAEVACHIGSRYEYDGKLHWLSVRAGYPEHIYADSKAYGRINAIDVFLEIEWAISQGYDCFDLSISLANPENGVLQWKRKLRGRLSLKENHEYFYIKPPRGSEPEFFWETPLISVKRGQLILHLGWPASQDEDAFLSRYKQMGFDGLATVNLYTPMQPSDVMLERLLHLYRYANTKPTINICH